MASSISNTYALGLSDPRLQEQYSNQLHMQQQALGAMADFIDVDPISNLRERVSYVEYQRRQAMRAIGQPIAILKSAPPEPNKVLLLLGDTE